MVCRNLSAFADAPRAGSAEAKKADEDKAYMQLAMHPVQAAPRQSAWKWCWSPGPMDAPRAGSAEAKR